MQKKVNFKNMTGNNYEYDGSLQHVVIRQPNYVAGTKDKPEVKIFMQTNRKFRALETEKLKVNQTVWMKWSSGPIVAKSKILSWHEGTIKNGDITKAREITQGTSLYHMDAYWKEVIKKGDSYYTIVKLHEEEWLDEIITPTARSLGSSWIFIDSKKKYSEWILGDNNHKKHESVSRGLPKSMRFNVLRRDDFTCQYCGRKSPLVELHVDHKIPFSVVKKHEMHNLVTACSDCNLGKSNKII